MAPGDAFLDALADRFATRVAGLVLEKLRVQPGFGAPLYATAKKNPCGSRKVFLRACRDQAFASFKQGRELAADWAEVERWWKAQARPVPAAPTSGVTLIDERAAACAPPKRRGTRAA